MQGFIAACLAWGPYLKARLYVAPPRRPPAVPAFLTIRRVEVQRTELPQPEELRYRVPSNRGIEPSQQEKQLRRLPWRPVSRVNSAGHWLILYVMGACARVGFALTSRIGGLPRSGSRPTNGNSSRRGPPALSRTSK